MPQGSDTCVNRPRERRLRHRVARARLTAVRDAEVRYVERDGDYLAFTVFGEGPHDLVVSPGQVPIDLMWELPQLAAFMEELGRIARVIVSDARGLGGSDPAPVPTLSIAETYVDDLRAVLDAADSDRSTLFQMKSGSHFPFFAATYPERVRSFIAVSLRSSYRGFGELSHAQRKRYAMKLRGPEWLRIENPREAHDPVVQRWWGRAARLASSPEAMAQNLAVAGEIDLGSVLPLIRVPTLVLHRRDNRVWDIAASREAAGQIPGARFVELPGAENDIFLGDTAPVLEEICRFLREPVTAATHDRVLATVLFTDIVASTEQLAASGDDSWRRTMDDHDRTMERLVAAHRGRIVKPTGDGILATFDGPARAVRCAAELLDAAAAQGITLRAGLHTGEIEIRPTDVTGIAVHTANRIAALADPNEILVSRTVVDLTAGSGLQFEPRGEHQLKGVPGTWPTFAAQPST
jgi:class 3 adenylate cyclase/pimeloyl-ACP methyl ester carboxylesterase